jgi:tRNA modification GTPase
MELARLDCEQTIVALSTAVPTPGRLALRAIVRLSGSDCVAVASRLLGPLVPPVSDDVRANDLSLNAGFSARRAMLLIPPGLRIPVEVCNFHAGRSYTGQPMVELHLPGSAALADRVIEAAVASGARLAEPGEFTLRALLSGRLDLTGAEAVAELIAARGDGQLRAAMQLADGRLVREVRAIVDRLADLLAEVEAALDFADEPLEFISPDRLRVELREATEATGRLIRQAGSFESEALEHRPTVALRGRPNVGKSSLMNRLTGLDRALCSPLPGTTRDVLAAPLSLADGEALLLDLAGVDDAAMSSADATGPVEQIAQDSARAMVQRADLLVIVLDATMAQGAMPATVVLSQACGGNRSEDMAAEYTAMAPAPGRNRKAIFVCNKIDLAPVPPGLPAATLAVSAGTGEGIESLKGAINEQLFESAHRPGEQLMLNARHRQALAEALAAMRNALTLAAPQEAAAGDESIRGPGGSDLLAGEVREAIDHLGQISGQVLTEDVLDRIFSRFCLGK